MLRRFNAGTRIAVTAAMVVTTTAIALAVPTSAYAAADRHRSESDHDSESSKTATATCDAGERVIGAGAKIIDGGGRVALAAMVPEATSVTARGEALAGHDEPWSVVAFAVCRPAADGSPVIVPSQPESPRTATCPDGTDLSGTGFDLPPRAVLTGLVPSSGLTVTVQSQPARVGSDDPVAYAICVPETSSRVWYRFKEQSPFGSVPAKSATVIADEDYPDLPLSGVGGEITYTAGAQPVILAVVFIDSMLPTADLRSVKAEAVTVPALWPGPVWPTPRPGARVDTDEGWSITTYAESIIAPDYYVAPS